MGPVPGGKDGSPEPRRDMVQGKPLVVSGEAPIPDWRRYARFTIWFIIAALITVFLVRNSEPTQIDFVFFQATASLWMVLLAMVILGAILGWMASWWWRRRKVRKD